MTSSTDPAVLALCRWFPPAVGGVENYLDGLYSHLPAERVAVVAPGGELARAHDVGLARSPGYEMRRTTGIVSADRKGAALEFGITAFRAARSGQFNQVHCGQLLMAPIAATLKRLFGLPYLIIAHGSEFTNGKWQKRRVAAFNAADAVVANSEVTYQRLLDLGVRREIISVVTPGVDTARFEADPIAREEFRADRGLENEFVIVSVGRLHPNAMHKGFDTSIQALALLRDRGVQARLLVVGDGPDRARLDGLVVENGLAEHVQFLGRVSDSELPAVYSGADCFLLSSRDEPTAQGFTTEGFGLVFLEAAAAGLPSVSTKFGGAQHAVLDGVTGVLAEASTPAAVADALGGLAVDRRLAQTLGHQGRSRVEQEFRWTHSAARLLTVSRALVEPSGAPVP